MISCEECTEPIIGDDWGVLGMGSREAILHVECSEGAYPYVFIPCGDLLQFSVGSDESLLAETWKYLYRMRREINIGDSNASM